MTDLPPVIQTYSGHYFKFLDPENSVIEIKDIAHALARLCRYTGHIRVPHYSVAQHSVLVSLMMPPQLALEGLLHDGSEYVLGDMSSPLKRLCPDYKVHEKRVERVIAQRFGLAHPMPPIVKAADLVLLATERSQFLIADDMTQWEIIRDVPRLPILLKPLCAEKAEEIFLERYEEARQWR